MATRRALSGAEGAAQSARVTERLEGLIRPTRGAVIAAYWPIRGELDLRGWMRAIPATGARIWLPYGGYARDERASGARGDS